MNHIEILDGIQSILEEHKNLCFGLGMYVVGTCGTRDASHGYDHMKQVAKNSLVIFNKMNEDINLITMTKPKFITFLLTVSWLHDVADKKYDHDGNASLQLANFLQNMFINESEFILDTIMRTSYSFEIKMIQTTGTLDWYDKLGNDGVLLRDIVSDADKIEAIGYQGVIRCMTYNIKLLKDKGEIDIAFENLIMQVREHANVKLLKLYPNYIRTEHGKTIAKPLHYEMIELLSDDNKLRDIYNDIMND